MSLGLWGLAGLFVALLINRAADCWLSSAPLQCGLTRHPARQALVLAGMPLLFMALARFHPDIPDLWAVCLFTAVLVLLAIIDGEQRRIPNLIVMPAMILALVLAWQRGDLVSAALGAALAFLAFLGIYALGHRLYGTAALGIGDVKLAGLIGAVMGLQGMPLALGLGVFFAGAGAVVLLVTKRARRDDAIPYGLFLSLAAAGVLVVGA